MIKLKDYFTGGSFHKVYLTSSIYELTETIGAPQCHENNGSDKVNVEWNCVTDCGINFYIYDWKYYRSLGEDEEVDFHIGGKNFMETNTALEKLLEMIKVTRAFDGKLDEDEVEALNELKDIYTNED